MVFKQKITYRMLKFQVIFGTFAMSFVIVPVNANIEIIEANQINVKTASDIEIVNGIAYVTDFYEGLKICNVSDINNPEYLGNWSLVHPIQL